MNKIENLLMRRAELVAIIKANKTDSANGCCQHLAAVGSDPYRSNCIERAYIFMRQLNDENNDCYSYQEAFDSLSDTDDGREACSHCVKVRANKRQRALLGKQLGAINSQLTKAGQRLLKKND